MALRFWGTQYPPTEYVTCSEAAGCAHDNFSRGLMRAEEGRPLGVAYPDCEPFTETRPRRFEDVRCHEDRLDQPLRWKRPRMVFVNSMSDLFHEDVPDVFIERVFSVMGLAEKHTFQILTKRPQRMLDWFRARRFDVKGAAILQTETAGECSYALPWPLPNVWLGVSAENQRFADLRVPLLLVTPAAVRFVSYEPALGPADFSPWIACRRDVTDGSISPRRANAINFPPFLDWIIWGGESGAKARPNDLEWARAVLQQTRGTSTRFFAKQAGASPYDTKTPDGRPAYVVYKSRKGDDMAEWPPELRVREFPRQVAA